jgi:hypothetical protein
MPTLTEAALCQLSDLKLWLGIANAADDEILGSIVTNISTQIHTVLRRDALLSASYTETYDGSGTPTQALLHYPITAVSSLKINNTSIMASSDGVQTGYTFDQYVLKLIGIGEMWQATPGYYGAPGVFLKGFQNVVVTYTAGYAEIPNDISQACIDWCAFRYRMRAAIGLKSKHLATGESVVFVDGVAIPAEAMAVLKHYKRRIPV